MSCAPFAERLKFMRDSDEADFEGAALGYRAAASISSVFRTELEAMKLSDNYQVGVLPVGLLDGMRAVDGAFADFAHVPQRWTGKIAAYAAHLPSGLEDMRGGWSLSP